MSEMLPQQAQHKDLIKALLSSLTAAVFLSYVFNVSTPRMFHASLGLIGLGLMLTAFLLVARAKVDRDWHAAAVIACGLAGLIVFRLLLR